MKDIKYEMLLEKNIKLKKETTNKIDSNEKFESELKNTNKEKRREEKRKEKIIKGEALLIEIDKNKNCIKENKNKLRKDLNYKVNKGKIKKCYKNNNKRDIINIKKNIFIIIMIFFNLILPNNNRIEYKFSNITLKIRGPGFGDVLYSVLSRIYYPNIIYINGNQNQTITYRYYFNETNNKVNLIWNNSIDNCNSMFGGCSDIIEIDLSNFDASKVTFMGSMFSGCRSLTSINLSNFNTSNVTYMSNMFISCSSLLSLNLSNFDTSKVTIMESMFYNCIQLISLDLSNFDTSNVTDMSQMFQECSSLTSLDLSNFDTSKVRDMVWMFKDCSRLTSLILSNFNTSKVTNMWKMFSGCSELEYINLKNFVENSSLSIINIFENVPDNIVACLNESSSKILGAIKNKSCYTLDCSDNWKINQKKLVNKTGMCFDDSNIGIIYNYEYQGLYYENCISGKVTNNKIINYCKYENEKCLFCPNISLIEDLCIECNHGYYEKENDNNTFGYKKCYKDPIGYYLDINESLYKKCFYSCEKCEIKGNNITHNCKECNNDYPLKFRVNNYFNCYQPNCNHYHYFDYSNNYYYCTIDNTCPEEYPVLDNKECKKINQIKNMVENSINNFNNKNTKEEEIKYYDSTLKNIEDILTSENYDTFYLDKGNNEIIELEKMKIILTTTENQKNEINSYNNNNLTNIDIGDCENSLRQFYSLTNDKIIYIKLLEIFQEGFKIPKIEYDIYSKLNGENLTKLNLDCCKNNEISLIIPVNTNYTLDKLNSSSDYYNNLCYPATTEAGTDIILKDRRNEFPSKAVCQDDCYLEIYNYDSKKAKCTCKAKESSSSFADMKIDKKKLLDNFKNIKNIANFNILKCIEVLFSKSGISKNAGFFIFIDIMIFHITVLFLFYKKKINSLINKINKISFFLINKIRMKKNDKNENKEIEEKKDEKEIRNNNIIRFSNINDINNNIINEDINNINKNNINNEINNDNEKIQIKKKRKRKKKKKKYKTISHEEGTNNKITQGNNNNINNIKEPENKQLATIMDYNEDELNNLNYDLASQIDKRSYWQYYFSLIKTNHEFIYAFIYNKDYNSKIIKIDLFIFGLALNYTVNGFFFNDKTMHNVYKNKGLFDLDYQLPLIVYSTLISMFISIFIKKLALSSDDIIEFKQSEETNNIKEREKELIKKLKIKFLFYFILSSLLLFFFWYYISMFNAVYRNTQYLLLKDTVISFGISLVLPFIIYLIPGLLRVPALTDPEKNKKCLYDLSKILTMWF